MCSDLCRLIAEIADTKPELGASEGEAVTYDAVLDRCVLSMVNEAGKALEEGVVACPEDVDLALVFAAGFAPNHGGLLSYADNRGISGVVTALQDLSQRHGDRYRPSSVLQTMAKDNARIFPERPLFPFSEHKPEPQWQW